MIVVLCIGYALAALACGIALFKLDRDIGLSDNVSAGFNVLFAIIWPALFLTAGILGVAWLLGKLVRAVRSRYG